MRPRWTSILISPRRWARSTTWAEEQREGHQERAQLCNRGAVLRCGSSLWRAAAEGRREGLCERLAHGRGVLLEPRSGKLIPSQETFGNKLTTGNLVDEQRCDRMIRHLINYCTGRLATDRGGIDGRTNVRDTIHLTCFCCILGFDKVFIIVSK